MSAAPYSPPIASVSVAREFVQGGVEAIQVALDEAPTSMWAELGQTTRANIFQKLQAHLSTLAGMGDDEVLQDSVWEQMRATVWSAYAESGGVAEGNAHQARNVELLGDDLVNGAKSALTVGTGITLALVVLFVVFVGVKS